MDADSVIAAGSVVAAAGCLAASPVVTLAGVAVLLVGCAWGYAVTRDPTDAATRSDTDGAQHHDVRRTVRP